MLHCSNCGGALAEGAGTCSYCDASVDLEAVNLGPLCPECMCAMATNAKFCNNCGVDINPESIVRAISDQGCPRCSENLVLIEAEDSRFYQCTNCQGLWLDRDQFKIFTAKREDKADPRQWKSLTRARTQFGVRTRRERAADAEASRGPNLRCPVCKRVMRRKAYAFMSSIYIDECKGHGFWFDEEELQEIGAFIKKGGLEEVSRRKTSAADRRRRRSRRRRLERKGRGRKNDEVFGFLALLAAISSSA
ncbi:MAG: Zn-finger nucleic acid-binding protein [Planctomycetota bacterium]|jgi:Zn-finger nucleic acid-binding protein